jgi:hypothetical protein
MDKRAAISAVGGKTPAQKPTATRAVNNNKEVLALWQKAAALLTTAIAHHPHHGAALLRLGRLRARPPSGVGVGVEEVMLADPVAAVDLLRRAGDALLHMKKSRQYWYSALPSLAASLP